MSRRIVRWDNAHSETCMVEDTFWFIAGWADQFGSSRVQPIAGDSLGQAQLQTRNGLVLMLI
jgi:hypothetical protein